MTKQTKFKSGTGSPFFGVVVLQCYSDSEKQARAKAPTIIFIDELEHARRLQDGGGDADHPDDFEGAGNQIRLHVLNNQKASEVGPR